jgi:hypothetical protein
MNAMFIIFQIPGVLMFGFLEELPGIYVLLLFYLYFFLLCFAYICTLCRVGMSCTPKLNTYFTAVAYNEHFLWRHTYKFTCFTPRNSLRRLALQRDVSVGCARTGTKLLHIRPYKITVVPEIKPMDYEKKSEGL